MSSRQLSLNDLKDQYINKQFNWLTITDIYRNEDLKKWFAVCQCKCGKVVHRQINKVTSGRLKSCGCFVKSAEFADKRRNWCANNTDKIRTLIGEVLEQRIKLLNNQYVGKAYNWLTILEVFPIFYENGRLKRYDVKCKCKCGKDTVTQLKYVISDHTKSCGCYSSSKEHSDAMSKFWKDNPDKAKERANKHSEWYKNNPDKVAEQGKRHSQWFKDNPDKVRESVEKYKQWCKNNPDKLAEQGKARSQRFKDNPDILKNAGKKISQWYKDNPDKVKEKSEKLSRYYKENPEAASEIGRHVSEWYKDNTDTVKEKSEKYRQWCKDNHNKLKTQGEKHSQYFKDNPYVLKVAGKKIAAHYKHNRLKYDISVLLGVVHHDHIEQLLAGNVRSGDTIKTKCPLCNNYDDHTLGNVFVFSRGEFKYGSAPLCSKCRNDLCITTSKYEQEIANYISTFYNGELIRNSRDIISPLELDLYYPEKKIAIEFNGNYWHSDLFKDKEYHIDKYLKCKKNGILLVSIFESEWNNKKDNISEYLKDLFFNKLNSLSISCCYMNNNYPSNNLITDDHINQEYYVCTDARLKVYTCGFSKIIGSI